MLSMKRLYIFLLSADTMEMHSCVGLNLFINNLGELGECYIFEIVGHFLYNTNIKKHHWNKMLP